MFRNPGRSPAIPFLIQVQSNRLEPSLGRVMVPMVICTASNPQDHPLTPHMTVQGSLVYANPLDLATVPANRLGDPVGTLAEADQDRIIRALDEMPSRA
jgi:toxin CcdB